MFMCYVVLCVLFAFSKLILALGRETHILKDTEVLKVNDYLLYT